MNTVLLTVAILAGIVAFGFILSDFLALLDMDANGESHRERWRWADALITGGISWMAHDCYRNWARRRDARRLILIGIMCGLVCAGALLMQRPD